MRPAGMILLICAGTASGALAAARDATSEWKFRQEVRMETPGLVKLALPEATLDAARPGLEDLRIFDASGGEVPYVVERVHPDEVRALPAKRVQVVLEKDATVVTVESGIDRPVDAVQLETSAGPFIKAGRVEVSHDGKNWKLLLSGAPIFREPGGGEQLAFQIAAEVWEHFRITLDDSRSRPIPVSGISLRSAPQPAPEIALSARIQDRKEDPGITRLELDLGARNLTLASVRIETSEPLFTRNVDVRVRRIMDHVVQEQTVASGTISRMAVDGQPSAERLVIPVEAQITSRDVLIVIENRGSPPIAVQGVAAAARPVFVVFLAKQAAPYFLLTGNPRGRAPAYDLSFLPSQLKKTPTSRLSVGALSANPSYHPSEPFTELALSATPVDVSAWKYRKSVAVDGTAVQEMDLDLEVLSHARNDFGDLRLTHQGKQFPYLIERASWTRELEPAVTAQQDSKNPHISRWTLRLPFSSLPIREVACRARTPLFRRSMRLYERVADERGSLRDRNLGQADWVQAAGDRDRLFLLSLREEPQTDTLILETDNGENPPLQLQEFTAHYPVTRLLFKPAAGAGMYLYYGNDQVSGPQYDIELAAQQLLEAEKSTATPGPEESLQAKGLREAAQKSAGILFWIALGVAVLVLFFVVSRLLPRT